MSGVINPLVDEIFDGAARVFMLGRPIDWKLQSNPEAAGIVYELAQEHHLTRIWGPIPDFSAKLASRAKFSAVSTGPFKVDSDIQLMREVSADGVVVKKGEGFYVSSGDCPTITLFDPVTLHMVCGHGGRNSVIDPDRINGNRPRKHESVVYAMIDCFSPEIHGRLRAHISLGISGKNYCHPTEGTELSARNAKMIEYIRKHWGDECFAEGPLNMGCLSIRTLVRKQLLVRGVKSENITNDHYDTFEDSNNGIDDPRWWSNRRGDKQRNLVFVVNNS